MSYEYDICDCGVPRFIGGTFVWTKDGKIFSGSGERYLFLPSDILEPLIEIGGDQESGEIYKEEFRHLMQSLLTGAGSTLAKWSITRGKWLYNELAALITVMGHGNVSVEGYTHGRFLGYSYENPVSDLLTTKMLAATFESFEGRLPNVEVSSEQERKTVSLYRTSNRPSKPPYPRMRSPECITPCCEHCGCPQDIVERFIWDVPLGMVIDKLTAYRFALISANWADHIIGSREETGQSDPMYEAARKVFSKMVVITPESDSLLNALRDSWVYGLGSVTAVSTDNGVTTIEAEGITNDSLAAAKYVSAFEEMMGISANRVSWRRIGDCVKADISIMEEETSIESKADWPF